MGTAWPFEAGCKGPRVECDEGSAAIAGRSPREKKNGWSRFARKRERTGYVMSQAALMRAAKMLRAPAATGARLAVSAGLQLISAIAMQARGKHGALSKRRAVKITGMQHGRGPSGDMAMDSGGLVPYWASSQLEFQRTAGAGGDTEEQDLGAGSVARPALVGFNNYAHVAQAQSTCGLLTAVGVPPQYATTLLQVRPMLGTMNPELVSFLAGQLVLDASKLSHVLLRIHPIFLQAPVNSSLRPKLLVLRSWGFQADAIADAFCESRKMLSVPGTEHMENTLCTLQRLFHLSHDEAASVLEREPRVLDLCDAALARRQQFFARAGVDSVDLVHAVLTYPELALGSHETLQAYLKLIAAATSAPPMRHRGAHNIDRAGPEGRTRGIAADGTAAAATGGAVP
ncbi:hypothetical protein FVE85_2585 [Porphyridium purpureum]|uniref:Uncharacterized protein n=1 Tax=Porphyridium purpureum TaxID=35688 RepID=A0A5J4YL03_PORPP|nr:hypothetical protein FVE85_2585 [Porphyridium purpureum]|eukprot:POR4155..scf291_13